MEHKKRNFETGTWQPQRNKLAAALILLAAVGLAIQFGGQPQLIAVASTASETDRQAVVHPDRVATPLGHVSPAEFGHRGVRGAYCPAQQQNSAKGSGPSLCAALRRDGSMLDAIADTTLLNQAQIIAAMVASNIAPAFKGVFGGCPNPLSR